MKNLLTSLLALVYLDASSQELYVFSEPASNMPARALTVKVSSTIGWPEGLNQQRYVPEIQLGLSKNLMVHAGATFSNMHSSNLRWESVYLYGKYRFLSLDGMHRHFRMAAFSELTHSRNDYHYDEVTIQGDRSGVQLGLIATQLVNKFAVSATLSHTQSFDPSRKNTSSFPDRTYQSMNYSLSAGLLVLPVEYKNYDQLNLNIYAELLGQKTLEGGLYYLDLAPAVQLIFKSNSKLNLGYRFQLRGNQYRGMEKGFMISFEHSFFNALKKKT